MCTLAVVSKHPKQRQGPLPTGTSLNKWKPRFNKEIRKVELTETALRGCGPAKKRGQAQVTDFHHASATIHEDVVALQITMDYRRGVTMQVNKALKNLPRPAFQSVLVQVLVLLTVPARIRPPSRQSRRNSSEGENTQRARSHALSPCTRAQCGSVLSQGTRRKELGDEIHCAVLFIDP
jgi:hypothetical protein